MKLLYSLKGLVYKSLKYIYGRYKGFSRTNNSYFLDEILPSSNVKNNWGVVFLPTRFENDKIEPLYTRNFLYLFSNLKLINQDLPTWIILLTLDVISI